MLALRNCSLLQLLQPQKRGRLGLGPAVERAQTSAASQSLPTLLRGPVLFAFGLFSRSFGPYKDKVTRGKRNMIGLSGRRNT